MCNNEILILKYEVLPTTSNLVGNWQHVNIDYWLTSGYLSRYSANVVVKLIISALCLDVELFSFCNQTLCQ